MDGVVAGPNRVAPTDRSFHADRSTRGIDEQGMISFLESLTELIFNWIFVWSMFGHLRFGHSSECIRLNVMDVIAVITQQTGYTCLFQLNQLAYQNFKILIFAKKISKIKAAKKKYSVNSVNVRLEKAVSLLPRSKKNRSPTRVL